MLVQFNRSFTEIIKTFVFQDLFLHRYLTSQHMDWKSIEVDNDTDLQVFEHATPYENVKLQYK